MLKFEEF